MPGTRDTKVFPDNRKSEVTSSRRRITRKNFIRLENGACLVRASGRSPAARKRFPMSAITSITKIGHESILVVRSAPDSIKAFYNVCPIAVAVCATMRAAR